MINDRQIIDAPMPEDRNFHWLKAEGLSYVQALAGTQWTNFNDSDPGVTILDQLCYALTELGYCAAFPIEDILSAEDGQINFQDQFYLPSEILTCTPVSVDDYRKLILDQEPWVKNVYIETGSAPFTEKDKIANGGYRVYLFIDPHAITKAKNSANTATRQSDEDPLLALRRRVNALLDQHRNMGEFFRMPTLLRPKEIQLTGKVRLTDNRPHDEVIAQIQLALDNFISPPIRKLGYEDMQALGLGSDEIFNGPRLNGGWIPGEELAAPKIDTVVLSDLARIVSMVKGVGGVDDLTLHVGDESAVSVAIAIDEIAEIKAELEIDGKETGGGLNLTQQFALDLLRLQQNYHADLVGASVNLTPALPQGRYRNIGAYYSVQNTFPLIYAIGAESLPLDSPSYRVAQSRQLKGYLMVFDQLLANQFAQLANIPTLFSFKDAGTIAPDQGEPYDGIPYQLFPPTYFCQPLYQIPDVKPLLRGGTDGYLTDISSAGSAAEEEAVWQRFQANPFNPYIQGLRRNMENDAQRDDRRNRMLDHLLARHGEPAAFYDEIISTARWYGSALKTRIIIKSIILQNLGLLSYNRTKAHSWIQAQKLGTPGRYRLSRAGFSHLAEFEINADVLSPCADVGFAERDALMAWIYEQSSLRTLQQDWDSDKVSRFEKSCLIIDDGNGVKPSEDYRLICNGQLNLSKLYDLEQLTEADFNNFATVELQINLLLGLTQHYQLLTELLQSLVNSPEFEQWLEADDHLSLFELPDSDISVSVERQQNEQAFEDQVRFSGLCLVRIKNADETKPPALDTYQAHLKQIQWLAAQRKGILLIESLFLLGCQVLSEEDFKKLGLSVKQFYLSTLLVFPDYITLFGAATFKQSLERLVNIYWPAHIRNTLIDASFDTLSQVIPAFIDWHNGLREAMLTQQMSDYPCTASRQLINLLLASPKKTP